MNKYLLATGIRQLQNECSEDDCQFCPIGHFISMDQSFNCEDLFQAIKDRIHQDSVRIDLK